MDAAMATGERTVYVTGSRRADLILFAVLLGLMLAASPRLRVYYRAPAAAPGAHGVR
jgi:hypothetical protein